jgi:PAS domain S-box-containing protein
MRSQQFLEKVLESLTHPFYVIDARDYTIKMANSAARFGELTGTCTCHAMTHRRDEPCLGEHPCPLEEVKRTKKPVVVEHVHYDKDGVPRNVEVHGYPILDEDGNVTQMIEYCLDITERKRADEEATASRQMLQLVMDNIPQHIFWKDANSIYLGCNKNFADDAGIGDPASIVGKTDYDMPWRKEESDFFREYDRRVMEADAPILHIIEPLLQADGKEAWLDTNKIPLHDAQGNVVGILGTYEDITERKLLEVENENARKALEEVYERERRIAETLQRSFLPDRIPALEGYRLAQAYYPALDEAAIGGDMYDVFRLPSGKVGIAIADVSGKGLRAARYGAMVKYMLRAYSYRTEDPAEILTLLNSSVGMDLDIDSFITCFFGILDPDTGEFVYANAGHSEPLYVPHLTGIPVRMLVTGPVLGLQESSTYTSETIALSEGDIVFLYTDGVTDARGESECMYIEGLEDHLIANCILSADALIECVLDEVRRRSGDRLADDVAMIALQVTEQPPASPATP